MPGVDFNVVRERVSLGDVLRMLQFRATRASGDYVRGPCPVHRSTDPRSRSFSADLRLGRYNCFGCGSGGNALELWAAVHRIGVYEAAIALCEALRIEVPWINRW
jgi:DNA primase